LVHHLQTGRDDARSDDLGDRIPRMSHLREGGQQNLGVHRRRQSLTVIIGV